MTGLAGPDAAHLKRRTDQNALKALSEALLKIRQCSARTRPSLTYSPPPLDVLVGEDNL